MNNKLRRSASDGISKKNDNTIFNFERTSPAPLRIISPAPLERSSSAPAILPNEQINIGIEQLVSVVVNRKQFQIDIENVDYLKNNNDNFYNRTMPNITLNGVSHPLSEFRIFSTPSDGTCLIHSVLLGLSQTYRKLNYKDKCEIGSLYRKIISGLRIFTVEEQIDLSDSIKFLDGKIAIKLANYLKFNLVIFPSDGFPESSHIIDGQPNVFIYCSGMHFSGIEIPEIDGATPKIDANELNKMIETVNLKDHQLFEATSMENAAIEKLPLNGKKRKMLINFLKAHGFANFGLDEADDDALRLFYKSFMEEDFYEGEDYEGEDYEREDYEREDYVGKNYEGEEYDEREYYDGGKKKSRKQRNKNKKTIKKSRKTK